MENPPDAADESFQNRNKHAAGRKRKLAFKARQIHCSWLKPHARSLPWRQKRCGTSPSFGGAKAGRRSALPKREWLKNFLVRQIGRFALPIHGHFWNNNGVNWHK